MCVCLIIGYLIESQPSQGAPQPSQGVPQPSKRIPHDQSSQGAHVQMSAVNIYNPNVIAESGHGMFANILYKYNYYSIIT